jgi:hypothetical protein
MLPTLETLTTAGQHHIMNKVVAFIDDQVDRMVRRASPGNQRMLAEQLVCLKRESDRLLPDVREFTRRAESLLALLRPAA